MRHPLIHHYDLFLQPLKVVLKEEVSYRLKKVEVRRKDAIDQVIFDKKRHLPGDLDHDNGSVILISWYSVSNHITPSITHVSDPV